MYPSAALALFVTVPKYKGKLIILFPANAEVFLTEQFLVLLIVGVVNSLSADHIRSWQNGHRVSP